MRRMLVKFTATKKDMWDEHLDSCVFAYNTSHQESTLCSPFEVMFGRCARLPVEIDTDNGDNHKLLESYIEVKSFSGTAGELDCVKCIYCGHE